MLLWIVAQYRQSRALVGSTSQAPPKVDPPVANLLAALAIERDLDSRERSTHVNPAYSVIANDQGVSNSNLII